VRVTRQRIIVSWTRALDAASLAIAAVRASHGLPNGELTDLGRHVQSQREWLARFRAGSPVTFP
jgi:hypothetical protein